MNAEKKDVILIVDDNAANLQVLSALLIAVGFEVLVAKNGENAIKKLQKVSPSLILLDVMMPGIDGFETCRKLKASPATKDIPVIFLTALSDDVDRVKGLRIGGVDYISKPFRVEEVIARVNVHIKLYSVNRQLQAQNQLLEQEIAVRKKTEERLRLLESAIENTNDAVVIAELNIDRQGLKIVYVNAAFTRMTGYNFFEAIGKTPRILEGPKTDPVQLSRFYESLANWQSVRVELINYRKDGSEFWAELEIVPFADENGRFTHWVCVQRDITERKQATSALRESEERFRVLVNSAPVGIFQVNAQCDCLFVNPRLLEMAGLSREEALGWGVVNALHPDDSELAIAQWYNAAQFGRDFALECRFRTPEGKVSWVFVSAVAMRDGNGAITGYLGTVTDISDRKHAEIEIASAKASLERLLGRAQLLEYITREIRSTLDIQQVFQTAANQIGRAFGVNRCVIHTYIAEPTPRIPQVAEYFEIGYRSMRHIEIPAIGNLHAELVLSQDQAVVTNDVTRDPLLEGMSDAVQQLNLKSILVVRTSYQGMPNGIICLEQCDRFRVWTKEEIDLLEAVAVQGGIAIAQAELLDREKQRRQELDLQNLQLQAEIRVRQEAESALRESQRFVQAIAEANPNILYVYDLIDQRNVYANREVSRILGYTPVEVQDMGAAMMPTLMHPDDFAAYDGHRKRFDTAKDGDIIEFEYRMRHSDGEWRWLYSRETVFTRTADGKPKQIIGTATDITERKLAEEKLRDSQQRLSFLVQQTPLAVIEWNTNFKVVEWNPAAELIFGYTKQEVIGQNTFEILAPESAKEQVNKIFQNILTLQGGICSINENLTKDGRVIICEWYNTPLIDDSNSVIGVASMAVDITERKQTEAALQQALEAAKVASRAKSQFLASMSHELRTPLNAILGFSQLMVRDNSLTKEQIEGLEIINRSGEHLLGLIDDILEMTKIEAGQITLNENSFDLSSLLVGLEKMLRLKAQAKGLQLTFKCAPDIPQFIKTDEGKLRQVLINLLGNAIKFTAKGCVTLRVRMGLGSTGVGSVEFARPTEFARPEQNSISLFLHFEIEDTGAGIAPEEIDLLFEPFVQTETGRKSQQGTGLGLAISRKFVQLMGGDITVSSIVGQGTVFAFDIQVRLVEATEIQAPKPKRKVIGLAPLQGEYRILVVDDLRESRLFLVTLFTSIGFQVREAENGREAVALWSSWEPHLICMDMRMPEMDGYEATKLIRSSIKGQATVIIALTANAFDSDRKMVLSAGCDDFVGKPFRAEVLLEKLSQHLGIIYIYEAEGEETEEVWQKTKAISLDADLKGLLSEMPADWVAQVHYASLQCNDLMILKLLEQVPPENAVLAIALTDLANNFQFEKIGELLDGGI